VVMPRRGENINGYLAAHKRLYRRRGKAREYPCAHCGGQAQQWATIHGRDGKDAGDYTPLCVKCHVAYDGIGFQPGHALTPEMLEAARRPRGPLTAQARANQSAARKGKPKTPEHKAAIAAALRGHVVSPETRAKLSTAQRARQERNRGDARATDLSRP